MAEGVNITIGPGEFIDRLTILRLKREKARTAHIQEVLAQQVFDFEDLRKKMQDKLGLKDLELALETVNRKLWKAEDEVRRLGADDPTDPALAHVARRIAAMNDERARLKTGIDGLFGWQATEIKIYGSE